VKIFIIYLIIINLYGIFIMYQDKQKAINRKWRTTEAKLFGVALILGSIGILSGMYIFHHKTKHAKFVIGIPLILIIQLYILLKYARILLKINF